MEKNRHKNNFRHSEILIYLFIAMFTTPIIVYLISLYFTSIYKFVPYISLGFVLIFKAGFLYICYCNVKKSKKHKKHKKIN